MSKSGNRAGEDEPHSPWLRSGFVLAVAFIGFVAVIGAVVLFSSDSSGEGGATAAATESPPRTPSEEPAPGEKPEPGEKPASAGEDASADEDASCPRLADKGKDVPNEAPEGVSWELFHAVALPASQAAGPAVAGKDVARCYARTPVGALLATSQISVRYLAADDWQKVTRAQTVGAGRGPYLDARAKSERTAAPDAEGAEDGAGQGQIAGFKFVTYTDSAAVIQTVWRFDAGTMQAATTTVLWRDGDWRLEYPAEPAAPTPVDSLAGYVEWGGV